MSHVFQTQDPGSQRLSEAEAKELIRNYQHIDPALNGSVTVQDMAETLGLPAWQVQQMVQQMRARQQQVYPGAPMSSKDWLKKRLWIWALVAIMVTGGWAGILGSMTDPKGHAAVPTGGGSRSGLYSREQLRPGRELGLKAPGGFSYEIKYPGVDLAVEGQRNDYTSVSDMTSSSVAVAQEELADDEIEALDKAIQRNPPLWASGQTVSEILQNYYPGGDPVSTSFQLPKDAFPYDPSSVQGRALHDQVLKAIKDNWHKITDEDN